MVFLVRYHAFLKGSEDAAYGGDALHRVSLGLLLSGQPALAKGQIFSFSSAKSASTARPVVSMAESHLVYSSDGRMRSLGVPVLSLLR